MSYVQRKDTEEDTSLTAGMAIPSHEEVNSETLGTITNPLTLSQVEFESPAHGNPEVDLLPVAALALDLSALATHLTVLILSVRCSPYCTGFLLVQISVIMFFFILRK